MTDKYSEGTNCYLCGAWIEEDQQYASRDDEAIVLCEGCFRDHGQVYGGRRD